MTDRVLFDSKLERVYYLIGKFRSNTGKRRFIKAPFDIIWINDEFFLMPTSTPFGCGRATTGGVLSEDEGDGVNLANHFAYDTLENIVMEPNEMGDFKSSKDNWMMVHDFSLA